MEAMGKLKVEPYRKEALRALGRTMGGHRIFPQLMEARLKCYHPACGVYKNGDQGESDDYGDRDLEDDPSPSAKLLRDQFRRKTTIHSPRVSQRCWLRSFPL
jgi:hypothetical protein